MTTDSRNPDLIACAIAANAHLGEALAELISIADAIRESLSTAVEPPIKPPLNEPQTREEALAAHRREHRMGLPGKIAGDPELEAFIVDKIATLTFAEVAESVAATFPPDRRTSTSAVHRWWQKRQAAKITIEKYQA